MKHLGNTVFLCLGLWGALVVAAPVSPPVSTSTAEQGSPLTSLNVLIGEEEGACNQVQVGDAISSLRP